MNKKLSSEDKRLIHALAEERRKHEEQARQLSNAIIADKFGVHLSTVKQVLRQG